MRLIRVFTIGAVAATIVGLGASIASLIDDLGPAATFCAETGCETVRSSAWARPLGIPMSALGVAFYAAMLVLVFAGGTRPRWWKGLALAGGLWAAWLIVLQAFVIGAWCKLCMVADPSAIVLAVCVLGGARALQFGWARIGVTVAGVAAVVLGVALWTQKPAAATVADQPAATPAFVTAARAPGKVTIVEVVDFECPFCREMQKRLDQALAQSSVPVQVVRKMLPLQMHHHALPAALAWCCAEAQGKGDAMARALFAAAPSELTDEGCEKIAERVGCDLERYRAAVPAARARVSSDVNEVRAAQIHKLPTMFINEHRVTGASMTADQLAAAIADAATEL